MIKRIINDKPTIMGLLTPFSDINMSIREQPIMLLHQSLHSLTDTYCIDSKHPTPMTIQLHPQCLLGIQGILRNWTFLIFKQV